MVKLTEEQRRELEALRNMPDDQIDFSDIPERPIDWSKARIAPFYRPMLRDYTLKLDGFALDCLNGWRADGQTLDDAVNKALRAQMFRIRFPVRVRNAEGRIRRIQESPEELDNLYEAYQQSIEILCAMPISEVVSASIPLKPISPAANPQGSPVIKDISLRLDENIIDWFEYMLEDSQSLDEAISKALQDHIHWLSSPFESQEDEKAAGKSAVSS